jgi:2-amino-4-hydroxy-6-hydroxymethyldihydropteridine diphosphokinase
MASKAAYLSLGSNVGNRKEHLDNALEALAAEQINVTVRSSIYETEPQDVTNQPWFLNLVVGCETRYFPIQMLRVLQRIERELGRIRTGNKVRRGPRTIDIDILLFGSLVLDTSQLVIPHPRMLERRFVLEPLLEIAPDLKLPHTHTPLKSYLPSVARQKVRKQDLILH